jgi:hypothetical protein
MSIVNGKEIVIDGAINKVFMVMEYMGPDLQHTIEQQYKITSNEMDHNSILGINCNTQP